MRIDAGRQEHSVLRLFVGRSYRMRWRGFAAIRVGLVTVGLGLCSTSADATCKVSFCRPLPPSGVDRKPIYTFGQPRERKEIARRIRFIWKLEHGRGPDVVSARISEQRTRLLGGTSLDELRNLRPAYDTIKPLGTAQLVEFTLADGTTVRQLWDGTYTRQRPTLETLKTYDQVEATDRLTGPYWRQFDLASTILVDDRGSWGKPIIRPEPVWGPFPELESPR